MKHCLAFLLSLVLTTHQFSQTNADSAATEENTTSTENEVSAETEDKQPATTGEKKEEIIAPQQHNKNKEPSEAETNEDDDIFPETGEEENESASQLDQVYLSDGSRVESKVISITDEKLQLESSAGLKSDIALKKVILIVYSTGKYRFFAPEKAEVKTQKKPSSSLSLSVFGGLGLISNGQVNAYTSDLAGFYATSANANTSLSGSFAGAQKQESNLAYHFGAEFRYFKENLGISFELGFHRLQASQSQVSATFYQPLDIEITSNIISYSLGFYYRFLAAKNHLLLGISSGLYQGSAILELFDSVTSQNEKFSGLAWGAALKVEYQFKLQGAYIGIGCIARYAEINRLENDGIALINGNSGKVTGIGITGIGAYIAAGLFL